MCKHLVDNAPSVDIMKCSKNLVDTREKNIQQRAKFLSLAGASAHIACLITKVSKEEREGNHEGKDSGG